jgi:hypothetical protein
MTLCSVLQNTGWFKVKKRIILHKNLNTYMCMVTHLNQINQSCNGSFFNVVRGKICMLLTFSEQPIFVLNKLYQFIFGPYIQLISWHIFWS